MKATIRLRFSTVHDLRRWLMYHMDQFLTPDEFYAWMESLTENGDEVVVLGENWTFQDMCDLV